MVRQLLAGGAISICNIIIHALVMTAVVRAAQIAANNAAACANMLLVAVMASTASVLMVAHTCEVLVWSLAYRILDAAPPEVDLAYFAFVNYTTLGYGDVLPAVQWRLLGPITAMNGVILFGWSTAVIFEVLRKAMSAQSVATSREQNVPRRQD